jgi:pilus assembly protein CpaE
VSRQGKHTLLIDMDFQFGSQNLKLDIHPAHGIMEALDAVESLDEIALMGYVAKHASGLQLLSASSEHDLILPGEVNLARLGLLIELIQQCYEHTVVDLPRLIDPTFNLVMEKADHVIVVLQQDISSLRDAQRIIRIMTVDLDVPRERIRPLINRYEPYNAISLDDIERTLGEGDICVVPNDYKRVYTAANLGVPLADHAPRSPATLSIHKLADSLVDKRITEKPKGIKQLLARLWSGG